MKLTNEKRCEVAKRLRNEAKGFRRLGEEHDHVWTTDLGNVPAIFQDIMYYAGLDGVVYTDVLFDHLADLIEPPEITEDTSDGYHTFKQLYYQRMMLFAVLVQEHKDCAWKTWNHEDGEPCFGGGWFLVTIDTPRGAYGYHCEEKYWNLFDCPELPKAKPWDGYTEENVNRLFSLNNYEVSGDAGE